MTLWDRAFGTYSPRDENVVYSANETTTTTATTAAADAARPVHCDAAGANKETGGGGTTAGGLLQCAPLLQDGHEGPLSGLLLHGCT